MCSKLARAHTLHNKTDNDLLEKKRNLIEQDENVTEAVGTLILI